MIIIEQYSTLKEANLKIQGGIACGVTTNVPFEGLVGLTITFTSPAAACTFTQPSGTQPGQLTFADLKSQLETQVPNLEVLSFDNFLCFRHKLAGSAVTLAAAVEPARSILGLGNNEAIAGRCLNGPNSTTPPMFLEAVPEGRFIYVSIEVANAGS